MFLPDESVDFGDINVIQLLDSMLDLVFVCFDIHNEHKRVVVLNLFHGGLCCQGELDDGIVIQSKGGTQVKAVTPLDRHLPTIIFLHYT